MTDKYFLYDPEGGFETYATQEACDKAADDAIQTYLDDGWDEAVVDVVTGIVTHQATQADVEHRPAVLNEEGCDEDGYYWADFEYRCNYTLQPIKTKH